MRPSKAKKAAQAKLTKTVKPGNTRTPAVTTKSVQRKKARRRRKTRFPLVEIGRARSKDDALAGLERWKKRHRKVASHLEEADVLVDSMRGRHSTWTRVRVNLRHVPRNLRPDQEPLDPDDKTLESS